MRQAAAAARQGFADGIVSPTVLLVQADQLTSRREGLSRLQAMLAQRPGVAGVVGPADQPISDELGLVLSRTGDAARYLLVLDRQPLGASGIETVAALRADLPTMLDAAGLPDARAGLGGDTAIAEEVVARTTADLHRIIVAALVVNLLMLILFLRALLAPLLLLGLNVLGLAAALGISTFVFVDLLGHDGLTFYAPFATALLLVALGSDYNIFTVGRVWQQAHRLPMRQALIASIPSSARAVTTAAIVLTVSFGLLALVPLRPFREIALTMSVGVLLDAVFVRSLLVPALLALLGPVSGWPSRRLCGASVATGQESRATTSPAVP